jgi:Tfp pilus assembly protein PilN
MIRINLLGVPKAKSKKRGGGMAAMSSGVPGEGPNPVVLIVIGLVAGLAVAGGLWYRANAATTRIAEETQAAEAENKRLGAVKAKFVEKEKQVSFYKRRVEVIDELRNKQSGPVDLLTMVGDTVSNTEAVWLHSMTDSGTAINFEGNALSVQAVANLIDNLDKTGYFKSVEIEESYQDKKLKDVTGFFFKIKCQKQTGSQG